MNVWTEQIIAAGISVHRQLGPGLLESVYEACLLFELLKLHFSVERQKAIAVTYEGATLDCGFRIDLLVNDAIVVEVKAVERVLPVHRAQLLSYLRLSDKHVGLLLNFNVKWFTRGGITRIVNAFEDE